MTTYRTREAIDAMYAEQETEAARISALFEIKASDLSRLNRIGKFHLIESSWGKLKDDARNALLHDEHAQIRSCAAIASRKNQ